MDDSEELSTLAWMNAKAEPHEASVFAEPSNGMLRLWIKSNRMTGVAYLAPDEARDLAKMLTRAATVADDRE
jgi:hypothetical protein